jgi:hypothetical protein
VIYNSSKLPNSRGWDSSGYLITTGESGIARLWLAVAFDAAAGSAEQRMWWPGLLLVCENFHRLGAMSAISFLEAILGSELAQSEAAWLGCYVGPGAERTIAVPRPSVGIHAANATTSRVQASRDERTTCELDEDDNLLRPCRRDALTRMSSVIATGASIVDSKRSR